MHYEGPLEEDRSVGTSRKWALCRMVAGNIPSLVKDGGVESLGIDGAQEASTSESLSW